MPRQMKTRKEIAAIVLAEVHKFDGCADVRTVGINHIVDDRVAFTWDVGVVSLAGADREQVYDALRSVVPKLQDQYDCAGEKKESSAEE